MNNPFPSLRLVLFTGLLLYKSKQLTQPEERELVLLSYLR